MLCSFCTMFRECTFVQNRRKLNILPKSCRSIDKKLAIFHNVITKHAMKSIETGGRYVQK